MIVVLVCVLTSRRRHLARYPRTTPLITASNTQDTPMDQTPSYSPQTPTQNMQPVAAYSTGQYADPQYHTSYPQQPPAPYPPGGQPQLSNPQLLESNPLLSTPLDNDHLLSTPLDNHLLLSTPLDHLPLHHTCLAEKPSSISELSMGTAMQSCK